MKQFFLFLFVSIFSIGAFAQAPKATKDYNKASDSDPKAKAILDKVRKKYEGYNSMEMAFTLDMEFPEQPKQTQKGKVARQGKKYRVEMPAQSVISDGSAIWLILPANKEVQINPMPEPGEDENLLSPETLFNFYNKGKFAYVLVNEIAQGGKILQQIEFKPLDKNFDYSKLRMEVDKKTNEVATVKAFGKDGSRFTMTITQLTPNKTFAASYFTFDKAKYPGFHVEDLR
ncbi:MAG: LolA family protein [Saprospiraceae bacterium]